MASGGLGHTCAIVGGGVQCWGAGGSGQLDNNSKNDSFQRVSVSGLTGVVQTVSAGSAHTCAVIDGAATCWGLDNHGQLGNGAKGNDPIPMPVAVTGISAQVQTIAAGDAHTCAIVNGVIRCWGANGSGQLGTPPYEDSGTPVAVGIANGAQAIAAGGTHSCAIIGGAVWCWGNNTSGQVGDPAQVADRHAPVKVVNSGASAVATGLQHTCAIINGGVQCWGRNAEGQLGDGSNTEHDAPNPVPGLGTGVIAIVAGRFHTCALLSGGAVKCWGDNGTGQLGDGSITSRTSPVAVVDLPPAQAIFTGYQHTCAIAGGAIRCWGNNGNGELATDPTNTQVSCKPIPIPQIGCSNDSEINCQVVNGLANNRVKQTLGGPLLGCNLGTAAPPHH